MIKHNDKTYNIKTSFNTFSFIMVLAYSIGGLLLLLIKVIVRFVKSKKQTPQM